MKNAFWLTARLAEPVVCFAWNGIEQLKHIEMLSTEARGALCNLLRARLEWSANPIVTSTFRRKRASTARQRSAKTINQGEELLASYPGICRLWTLYVDGWQRFVADFVTHSYPFSKTRKSGKRTRRSSIAAITPFLSDPHNGGRTVMKVRFADGSEWYYKPRSGCQEVQWFKLIRWINREGFCLSFRAPETVSARDHCWMQAVPSKRCRTKAQTERLYFRSGALAYLIFLLRGVDFHAANLVVNGENPVFVDVETLLHPVTATPPEFQEQEASILRTGLLPAIGCRDSHSGFTQLARHWHNARSGGVTSVPEPLVIGLLDGFNAMHAFLTAKRHRLRHLERLVAELARSEGRIVYRPSEHYARALFQSFAPELMRTARDRRSFLLHFCERNWSSKRRVLEECAALENGDIPVFRSSLRRIRLDLRPKIASEARMLIKRHLGFTENFCSPPGA